MATSITLSKDSLRIEQIRSSEIMLLSQAPTAEVIQQVRQGLSVELVKGFIDVLHVPTDHFADVLGFSPRTFSRRLQGQTLTGDDAAKVLRYAKVFSTAVDTFGNPEMANRWLETPNVTLPESASPASLLDTEFGAEAVNDTLLRIQHGVFA